MSENSQSPKRLGFLALTGGARGTGIEPSPTQPNVPDGTPPKRSGPSQQRRRFSKQLPDKSFKALATGVLSKLGEKVAGEAGKAIAAEIVGDVAKPAAKKAIGFLTGLLAGDAKGATKGITKDDFLDV